MAGTHSLTRIVVGTLLGIGLACQPDRTKVEKRPVSPPLEEVTTNTVEEPNTVDDVIYEPTPEPPQYVWKSNSEYGKLVKQTVQRHFEQDVREMYGVFGIRPVRIPIIKFEKGKGRKSRCEGAVYDFKTDDITFIIGCEDNYTKYVDDLNKLKITPEQVVETMRDLGRHEAAHDFTSDIARRLRAKYWFREVPDTKSDPLGYIASLLISEGIATYMERYGTRDRTIKQNKFPFTDEKFHELLGNVGSIYVYEAGFHLVEPILQRDFHVGMRELVRTPLTKRDLYNLPDYRQRILERMAALNSR